MEQKTCTLRCDNGTKYTNEKVKTYCRQKGMKLDFTVPYTPQQNGRAEQLNRSAGQGKGHDIRFRIGKRNVGRSGQSSSIYNK